MAESKEKSYVFYRKMVWLIYSLVTLLVIILLVTLVARDLEEMFFYSFMTTAGAYVFRPSAKIMEKWVAKLFGVKPPVEIPAEPDNE